MIMDLGYQYMDILHNNKKHISNVVNSYFDDLYAHILSISISYDVWNIFLPSGMT